jgi:hypothetical protein
MKHVWFVDDEFYVIPNVGTVVVGGTQQRGNYNDRVDPVDTERIWATVTRLWPALSAADVVQDWVRRSSKVVPVDAAGTHKRWSVRTLCWRSKPTTRGLVTQNVRPCRVPSKAASACFSVFVAGAVRCLIAALPAEGAASAVPRHCLSDTMSCHDRPSWKIGGGSRAATR